MAKNRVPKHTDLPESYSIFTSDFSSYQIRAPRIEIKTDCTLRSPSPAAGLFATFRAGASQTKARSQWLLLHRPKDLPGIPNVSMFSSSLAFYPVPLSKHLCSVNAG
jgi:hypothetical protein